MQPNLDLWVGASDDLPSPVVVGPSLYLDAASCELDGTTRVRPGVEAEGVEGHLELGRGSQKNGPHGLGLVEPLEASLDDAPLFKCVWK